MASNPAYHKYIKEMWNKKRFNVKSAFLRDKHIAYEVLLDNGVQVSAPSLRKKRQVELLKSVLNPKYAAEGFRTVDILNELSEFFQNCGQIRYKLQKLRVRGLIERVQGNH
jgi:hypothetical protein